MYHELFDELNKTYSGDADGEKSDIIPSGMTLGVVVDTDDPLQMGRLRVFCPALNDNPKKIQHLPWALYISPYGGSINNKGYTRGNDPGNCTTSGSVQYGFWGIPEQGAHVLVGCIDGDTRRRFWIGCAYEHQETHGILTGRWEWDEGSGLPNGPLSSTKSPIQPLAQNLVKAFNDNTSREWRTRAADYQVCAVREDVGQTPNANKSTYLDEQYDKISQAEPDGWVKPIDGANGYDWSGYKSLGSFMASRVYGMSSPGFHSFIMDDRAFNSRIKIRSGAGHQIILDDTNERIYINTFEGKSWIEMDKSGNIDVYAKRRLSFHAEKDINFTTDESFRVWAKKSINLYSGNNNFQDNLPNPPQDGEIRIQAEADIHVITKQNYRHLSFADTLWEVGGKVCETVGQSLFLQVQNEIDILTNAGDYNLTVSGNLNEMVKGSTNKFAVGTMTNASRGNAQMFTFDGKMDVGSQLGMNIKSMSQDVTMEAVGSNSGKTGGVFTKSPQSQHAVTSSGITSATNKDIKNQAKNIISNQSGVPTNQDYPQEPANVGDCNIGNSIPTDGLAGADLAAALAYNAGYRGDALVTAVAIAGAESSYNPGAVGDVGLQNNKWGPSVGLWQIRTLNNPGSFSGVDTQRDNNIIGGSGNAQNNANTSFALSKNGTNFSPWSTYTDGSYKNFLNQANTAVTKMCNPTTPPPPHLEFERIFNSTPNLISIIEGCLLNDIVGLGNLMILSQTGINMQSINDIAMKGLGAAFSTTMFGGIVNKLQEQILAHNFLSLSTGLGFAAGLLGSTHAMAVAAAEVVAAVSVVQQLITKGPAGLIAAIASQYLPNLALTFLVGQICSYKIPFFDPVPTQIFFSENFDRAGGTNIGMPASSGNTTDSFILD